MKYTQNQYLFGSRCERLYWLNKDVDVAIDARVKTLANEMIGYPIAGTIEKTKELLNQGVTGMIDACFEAEGCQCCIDALKILEDNQVEIYDVTDSVSVTERVIEKTAYQNYILFQLGYEVMDVYSYYVNNHYRFHQSFDVSEFFTCTNITSTSKARRGAIEEKIESLDLVSELPKEKIGYNCLFPERCAHFAACSASLPHPNVYDVANMENRKMVQCAIFDCLTYEQLANSNRLTAQQRIQVECELSKKSIFNQIEIEKTLKKIEGGQFVSVKTISDLIPHFEDCTPNQKMPVEVTIDEELFAFDEKEDNRKKIADVLIEHCPGKIIVYNKISFAQILNTIIHFLPEYKEQLERIKNNTVDIMPLFLNKYVYVSQMAGESSLEAVYTSFYEKEVNDSAKCKLIVEKLKELL